MKTSRDTDLTMAINLILEIINVNRPELENILAKHGCYQPPSQELRAHRLLAKLQYEVVQYPSTLMHTLHTRTFLREWLALYEAYRIINRLEGEQHSAMVSDNDGCICDHPKTYYQWEAMRPKCPQDVEKEQDQASMMDPLPNPIDSRSGVGGSERFD